MQLRHGRKEKLAVFFLATVAGAEGKRFEGYTRQPSPQGAVALSRRRR
jgi:hypothetical protein